MTQKHQNSTKNSSNSTENNVILVKNDAKMTKKEVIMHKKDTKVVKNSKKRTNSQANRSKMTKTSPKSKVIRSKSTKNTSKGGNSMTKERKQAEAVLKKVAKQFGLEVNRIKAKRNATSDVGPLQVRKDGKVKLAVKTHDILVFSPQSYLKLGNVGPKHFEYLTVFKFGTDPKILEKAFIKGLKDKKTGEQWANEMKCRSYRRTPVNLKERKKRLEEELKAVEKRLAEARKTTVKRKTKKVKKTTKVTSAAIQKVAVEATA